MQLSRTVAKRLNNMSDMLSSAHSPVFAKLSAELDDLRGRLDEPLRVAVVGVMKAGKSTLINAILKERVLYTAALEATFTVSWFKYGETPGLKIQFYDGSEQDAPFSELEKWTVRPEGVEKHRLDDVKCVIIYYPNEMLKTMELVDTPGLESTHETDSRNTQNFLGIKLAKDADRITAETASQAEAIIYAFSRGVQGRDADVLDAFRGDAGDSSPINAIGLFTKADIYWNCAAAPDTDPLDTVAEACDGYKTKLRDKLYTILPVTAKSTETVFEMDGKTFSILTSLAELDEEVVMDFLVDALTFKTAPADGEMPIPAEDRKRLLDLFGQYGIYAMLQALRNGVPREALPDYMYELSGVKRVSGLILRHFGNRAYLIKLEYVLRRIRGAANRIKHQNYSDARIFQICDRIVQDIDHLRENEHVFRELETLQAYYNRSFQIAEPELEEQFLQITGEYGSDCASRLGFAGAADIRVMKQEALARSRRWNGLANDLGTSVQLKQAAMVIVRSCDNLYYHLDMLSGFDR